jgi:selenocysteine-specific translation elongation factor
MAKRKRKETAEPVNGELKSSKYTERLFEDGRKLHDLRMACGHLKRIAAPGPVHLQKFIDRVFAIAGVGEESQTATTDAAQS